MESFEAGTLAGAGSFRCEECGFAVALQGARSRCRACPSCGGRQLPPRAACSARRLAGRAAARGPVRAGLARARRATRSCPRATTWPSTPASGVQVVPLARTAGPGSAAASRPTSAWTTRPSRAAMRSSTATTTARTVLDDRSLNGVFLNGESVDLAELEDGDAITVGRFTPALHVAARRGRPRGAGPRRRGRRLAAALLIRAGQDRQRRLLRRDRRVGLLLLGHRHQEVRLRRRRPAPSTRSASSSWPVAAQLVA